MPEMDFRAHQEELRKRLLDEGASLVGFADISGIPADARQGMRSAVSIAAALDISVLEPMIDGPTIPYHREYVRANELLTNLGRLAAGFLSGMGIEAHATAPTVGFVDDRSLKNPLPHKTVATRAGLGWVGKSAILVTMEYGPAVRLVSVLFDAEVDAGKPCDTSLCGDCDRCVTRCPAKALTGRHWHAGCERGDILDVKSCWDMAKRLSSSIGVPDSICGVCIAACPWTIRYIDRQGRGI